jgi:hypothetical protein
MKADAKLQGQKTRVGYSGVAIGSYEGVEKGQVDMQHVTAEDICRRNALLRYAQKDVSGEKG